MEAVNDRFEIHANGGKILQSDIGLPLRVKSRALAEALAEVWLESGPKARNQDMPMVRLAINADPSITDRSNIERLILMYAETDLICYRAAEKEKNLEQLQKEMWDPLLKWILNKYDAKLEVTTGIMPFKQTKRALNSLSQAVKECSNNELSALYQATITSSSLVIGLALIKGRLEPESALTASVLDEKAQAEVWGSDCGIEQQILEMKNDFILVKQFIELTADV